MRKSLLVATLTLCLGAAAAHAAGSSDQGAPNVPLGSYDTKAGEGLKNPLEPSPPIGYNPVDFGSPTEPSDYTPTVYDHGASACISAASGREYTFSVQGGPNGFTAKCDIKPWAK